MRECHEVDRLQEVGDVEVVGHGCKIGESGEWEMGSSKWGMVSREWLVGNGELAGDKPEKQREKHRVEAPEKHSLTRKKTISLYLFLEYSRNNISCSTCHIKS
jgi:hypothetical protein